MRGWGGGDGGGEVLCSRRKQDGDGKREVQETASFSNMLFMSQGYREDTCDETILYSSKSETAGLRRGTNVLPSLAKRLTTSSSVILSSGVSLCV